MPSLSTRGVSELRSPLSSWWTIFLRLHGIVGCLCAYFLLTLQTDCRVLLREVKIQVADYVRNNKLKYKSNVKDLSDYR